MFTKSYESKRPEEFNVSIPKSPSRLSLFSIARPPSLLPSSKASTGPLRRTSMEGMQQRIRQITGGVQAKLARLKEILTWFDNEWEILRTVRAMWKCMRKSETTVMRAAMYSSAAVTPQSFEFIEYLLWAMVQTDSPEATVRQRWWAYRSKVEHLEDNESIEYGVSFVRVQSQPSHRSIRSPTTRGGRMARRRFPTVLHGSLDAHLVSTVAVGFKVTFALT